MHPGAPRRGWRKLIAVAACGAACCTGAGVASAAGGGGVGTAAAPTLRDVVCIERCAGQRRASAGSRVRLDGRGLDDVTEVRFASGAGRIAVAPRRTGSTSLEAKVPEGAATGTVQVRSYGAAAETPPELPLEIVAETQTLQAGDFKLTSARAAARKTFYDGTRKPQVEYFFQGAQPTDVRVEVVDRDSKEVVASLVDEAAEPGAQNRVTWNGRTAAGALAGNGAYKFRIGSIAGGDAETTRDSRFGFYRYRFPIQGRHQYGDGFGAGRNHQGQDVFAKCGTTLRAARGGRVKFNKSHAAAGNYLVIDNKRSRMDFMYAHLSERSPLKAGARVRTGQKIGRVGDTGNASGCHLHFEAWSAPGWYDGGRALPKATKLLKSWDRWS